jgi:multidrug resistance efflux pump
MPESDIDKRPRRTKVCGVLLAAVVAIGSLILVAITSEPKSAVSSPGPPTKAVAVPEMASTKSEVEILFRGKSFCVVKRKVVLPFAGEIMKVDVEDGQSVKKDDVLVTYKLDREAVIHVERVLFPETVQNLKKTLSDQQTELEKLVTVTLPIRKSEEQRLEKELSDLRELHSRKMASSEAVDNKDRDLDAVRKQLFEVTQSIAQAKKSLAKTQQDLDYYQEKQQRDLDLLEWQTGRSYADKGLPTSVAYLKAPISGQIIWLSSEIAEKVEVQKGFEALSVAAMSPMVVRCKVHELDLVRLKTGDRGTVTFDAMPTRKCACKITRIPWVSRNPALDVPADYEIECLLENPDEGIKDGLTCNVRVHVAR